MGKHCPCLILAILLFKANVIFSQQKQNVYELKKQLTEARADTVRFRILDLIATDYLWYADQTDSAFSYASAEMEMAGKLNQPLYTAEAYLNSGWWFTSTAAFGTAIELFTKARHLAEENHFNTILVKAYQALCVSYSSLGNMDEVISLGRKAQKLLSYYNDPLFHYQPLIYGSIAHYYKIVRQPDTALRYAHLADEESLKYPAEPFTRAITLEGLAEVYDSISDYESSSFYFEKAIHSIDTVGGFMLGYISIGYSKSLLQQRKYQQAVLYSSKGFSLATRRKDPGVVSLASRVLYEAYSSLGKKDSALFYIGKYMTLNESILSDKSRNEIQSLTFTERIRNMELEKKAEEEAAQRKRNIQYAAIALCLISFVILYLLLSQSIISARFVKYLGLLGLLIVFEFINLLIHPFISAVTNESPLLMLIILVTIGALLIPWHHQLEQWVIHKLVEKNKRLKEEKIKRIVEAYQLRSNSSSS